MISGHFYNKIRAYVFGEETLFLDNLFLLGLDFEDVIYSLLGLF